MKSEWGRSSLIIHLKLWFTCLFTFYVLFIWFLLVFFFVLRVSLSFTSLRRFVSASEVIKKINWRPIIARHRSQTQSFEHVDLIFKFSIYFNCAFIFECHRVVWNYSFVMANLHWWPYFLITLGYNWTSCTYIMVQLDVRHNCLAMLRNNSTLLG